MLDSFKRFMAGLIDYAGLFPPAELDLEPAIINYASYVANPDRWMLSNFIIPANKLQELTPEIMALFGDEGVLNLSIISQDIPQDIKRIVEFRDEFHSQSSLIFFETRVREDDDIERVVLLNNAALKEAGLNSRVFYETAFDANWRDNIISVIKSVEKSNKEFDRNDGFKLRCGGVEASMFPSVNEVATALQGCREAGLAMKFTAGLHHPIRHFDAALKVKVHGFMNIFVAGILGFDRRLDIRELQGILAEENPESFVFTEDGLRWNDYFVTSEQISFLRKNKFISYGSCSFDEPREDLKTMGLLV